MTPSILIASSNPGKREEIRALLQVHFSSLPTLVLPTDLGLEMEVTEDGFTYAQNATLKACAYWDALMERKHSTADFNPAGWVVLADDSGLEVDALEGAPGLHSARFAPPAAEEGKPSRLPFSARRAYLVESLQRTSADRPWKAAFHCTLAIAAAEVGRNGGGREVDPDCAYEDGQAAVRACITFHRGTCSGEIIPQERGTGGFGYDPLFLLPQLGRTMAELSMEEKNTLSHRARAVEAALPRLRRLLVE